jgi:glutathione peroxidase
MAMTARQKILRMIYPLVMKISKWSGKNSGFLQNKKHIHPKRSIYDYTLDLSNGQQLPLSSFKGKKLLLVNTASDCGYTNQFSGLQTLHEQQQDHLAIIGIPSNDFKEQEKGDDKEIASFCQVNFGVSFPLSRKAIVTQSEGQHPLYQWLSSPELNGWNSQAPEWNFSKYLISEEGVLTHYFGPALAPGGKELASALSDNRKGAKTR